MSNDQYYGGQQYDPYANGTGNTNGNGQPNQGQQSPDVTQTWEGQTWDTTYQPAVSYEQVRADRAQAQQAAQQAQQGYQPQQPQQPYEPYASNQASYESYGTPAAYYTEPQPQPQPQSQQEQAHAQAHGHAQAAPAPAYAQDPAPVEQEPVPAAAGEAGGPAWSSPTTSGNTRITDAQRARAEGRSPVIEPGMQPAALTAVLGLLIAAGAALGTYGLLLPLVLLRGLTAMRLVPAQRHVARPAGHRPRLRRMASPPTRSCSPPAGSTRPPRSSARSASGCCSAWSSSCAATPTRTSACTA